MKKYGQFNQHKIIKLLLQHREMTKKIGISYIRSLIASSCGCDDMVESFQSTQHV